MLSLTENIAKNDTFVQFLSKSTYFKISRPSDVTYIETGVTDLWLEAKGIPATEVKNGLGNQHHAEKLIPKIALHFRKVRK